MSQSVDMTGRTFGALLVAGRGPNSKAGKAQWVCRCACGTTKVIAGSSLRRGLSTSCGCLNREKSADRKYVHGLTKSPEYRSWAHMKTRCYNPNYPRYADWGGRGITVCERWKDDFAAFYEDMGPRPGPGYTLGRIDNDAPYSPENCRWETAKQQRANRRDVFSPKTHCKRGHEYTAENTGTRADGARYCRACARDYQARYAARKRAKA